MLGHLAAALRMAGLMGWSILWGLVLGFTLSAVVQAVISKDEMTRLLPDASPRSLAIACGLGAASSSCSYAAVALTRSLVAKGADFTAAMAFQLASTNLVAELGILLAVLIGWQFTLAELVGGPLLVAFVALLFRALLRPRMVNEATRQARRGVEGKMEGHAAMDMSVRGGSVLHRVFSPEGFTAISHVFVMDWAAIWMDVVLGLLIAGALAAWVPSEAWSAFFFASHPTFTKVWGPLVGPVVAILSFVCSVGNVPLAAVLWSKGISFGGAVAFLLADLLVLPILDIYRKYYGWKTMGFLLGTFYAAIVAASLCVELLFGATRLIPHHHRARLPEAGIHLDYTTALDGAFLLVAVGLVVRFCLTGGPAMMRKMRHA